MNRRDFLKGLGAAIVAAPALPGAVLAATEPKKDEWIAGPPVPVSQTVPDMPKPLVPDLYLHGKPLWLKPDWTVRTVGSGYTYTFPVDLRTYNNIMDMPVAWEGTIDQLRERFA